MRLEPRSRDAQMNTSLQARIYDPLWLLARQWQFGEFQGADNGSPVMARWRAESARLTRYYAGAIANTTVDTPSYDGSRMPLETLVEQETIRPATDQTAEPEKLRLAAEAGQQFLRMLDQQSLSRDYRDAFIREYPFPTLTTEQCAPIDSDSISFCDLMASRVPDGRRLYAAFRSTGAGDIVIAPVLQIAPTDLATVKETARLSGGSEIMKPPLVGRTVLSLAPEEAFHRPKRPVRVSWRRDETYIKAKRQWYWLYRGMDKIGQTIDTGPPCAFSAPNLCLNLATALSRSSTRYPMR